MIFSKCVIPFIAMLLLLLFAAAKATAQAIFTATNISLELSANVAFYDLGGGQLKVELANIYTGDTINQAHVLTGVFFSGADGLTPVSATAPSGSLKWMGGTSSPAPNSTTLGAEWAYGTGSAPNGAMAGIVSAGYYGSGMGNFGSGPHDMLDGTSYGLVSAGYAGSAQDGLMNRIYIQDSIDFILSGFNGNLNAISGVSFQYGSTLSEPNLSIAPVPEPSSAALAGLGLAGHLIFKLRKTRSSITS